MRRSLLVGSLALVLVVTGGAAGSAAAAEGTDAASGAGTQGTAASSASGPLVQVTLQLAQPNAPQLKALGRARGLSRAARLARLSALLPSTATRSSVAAAAAAAGLTVVRSSPVAITVNGTQASVRAAFGDPSARSGPRPAALHVPASMQGMVAAAVSSEQRVVQQPAFTPTTTDGKQAAAVYHAPVAPPIGGSTQTVATIQLTGWDPGDLTQYAADHSEPLGDPVASGQYTAVPIDGAEPDVLDGSGNDVEVALDQESILDTAPYAKQRVYFAPDLSEQNFIDAFDAVAADAVDPAAGFSLTALSVSWGSCEDNNDAASMGAVDSAISTLESAGVTVFVASGDNGAFDCASFQSHTPANDALAVQFPASAPDAIAVGGTSLDDTVASSPVEQSWWTPVPSTGPESWQGEGSGGGLSAFWGKPAYQSALAGSMRSVPDISLDADPSSGFMLERYVGGVIQQQLWGGTSLASPLAAATYADLLGSRGFSSGLGDIHDALYSAPAAAFRDVTTGTNGHFTAGPGYDLATGLGAPLWSELAATALPLVTLTADPFVRSDTIPLSISTPPAAHFVAWAAGAGPLPTQCSQATSATPPDSVHVPSDGHYLVWVLASTATNCDTYVVNVTVDTVAPVASVHAPAAAPGTFTWSAGDAAPSSGISGYTVTVTHGGGSVVDYSATTTATSFATDDFAGTTYVATVVAHDNAGNSSAAKTATFTAASSSYFPVTPCRVFDTRTGTGTCSGAATVAAAPLTGGEVLPVQLAGVGGIPLDATAVILNVTAVGATAGTYVSVYPDGGSRPVVSTVNLHNAAPVANLVVVPLRNGKADFFNATGRLNLLADLAGYYAPASGSLYTPVAPCRVFDTRRHTSSTACAAAPVLPAVALGAGQTVTVPLTGVAGIPADATAVVLNVTAVGATRSTYVSTYPAGSPRPLVSNLNVNSASAVANLVVVPLHNGGVTFFNAAGTVNLLADLAGYESPDSGSSYVPVAPCRVFDTRSGTGTCPGAVALPPAQVGPGGVLHVDVTDVAGVSADATAVVLNVTAVGATTATYLTAFPDGTARPGVSNLNVGSAQAVANLVVVPVVNGAVDFANNAGSVDVIADISGYFAPAATG